MPDFPVTDITATPEWAALAEHHRAVEGKHLRELFADDPGRAEALTASGVDLVLDHSKHRITRDTLPLLAALARAAGLPERTAAMFAGEHINTSEDRAVLHTALRLPRDADLVVDGQDVVADVHAGSATGGARAPPRSAPGSGPVTPASGSPRSSTSASVGPTWAR